MLLKLAAADMLNTGLIDVSNGQCIYDIITAIVPSAPNFKGKEKDTQPECRRTTIKDALGETLVSISWNGRHPDITILGEKVGGLTDLFGSATVRFMPKILVIPTRFDTEYVWTATADSLTLFDHDSGTTKGTFYQDVIRLSTPFKSKANTTPSHSSPFHSVSLYSSTLPMPLQPSKSTLPTMCCDVPPLSSHIGIGTVKSSFISTRVPGMGSSYLEFCHHPLAHDVEIILSFLMMEILRRGRFLLTPFTFEKPKIWRLKETRNLIIRRLRRNTV